MPRITVKRVYKLMCKWTLQQPWSLQTESKKLVPKWMLPIPPSSYQPENATHVDNRRNFSAFPPLAFALSLPLGLPPSLSLLQIEWCRLLLLIDERPLCQRREMPCFALKRLILHLNQLRHTNPHFVLCIVQSTGWWEGQQWNSA